MAELREYFSRPAHIVPDYITFSGSGEPTLNSEIGILIKAIKAQFPTQQIALITNSTTMCDESIHADLSHCDLIMPSLDAVSDKVFQRICRPHHQIKISDIIESLIKFRKSFYNQFWIEIFFIEGINDTEKELTLFKETLVKINPDKIHLNSLDRAAAENWVSKLSNKRLQEIQKYLQPLQSEIV